MNSVNLDSFSARRFVVGSVFFFSLLATASADSLIELSAGATAAEINAAVQDVDAGGTVRLGPGTFTLSAVVTLNRGVTLEGSGVDVTFVKGNGGEHRGIEMTAASAVIRDMTLTGHKQLASNGTIGSAVYMSKGLVTNCRFTNNTAHRYSGKGAAIYITGGTVSDCVFDNNKAESTSGGGDHSGGAIYMTNGTVDNCLVVSNTALKADANYNSQYGLVATYGGGVYMSGGTLKNSTIADNFARRTGGGVYRSGTTAVITNCVIAGNTCNQTASEKGCDLAPNAAITDSFNTLVGEGEVVFAKTGSTFSEWYALQQHSARGDVGWNPGRISTAVTGIGADKTEVLVNQSVTLSPRLINSTASTYFWSVTGPNSFSFVSSDAEPSVTLTGIGRYTVSLAVDGGSPVIRTDWLYAAPLTNYVALAAANPVWPYDTPEKATSSIQNAIDACPPGGTVFIGEGEHSVGYTIKLDKGIRIAGAGRATTTIKRTGSGNWRRVFQINHPDAVVSGVTIKNGYVAYAYYFGGGNVWIGDRGGTVEDCRITAGRSDAYYGPGGGVQMNGTKSVLRRTIVDNNTAKNNRGGGVALYRGLIDNCLIYGNTSAKGNGSGHGGGVVLCTSSAKIVHSTIVNNTAVGGSGGGIFFASAPAVGQVVDTMIVENVADSQSQALGKPDWYYETGTASDASAAFVNCAFETPAPTGTGSVAVAAPFENASENNYHILGSSPSVDAGADYEGMGEYDLDGNPRKSGSATDIGCYEVDKSVFDPTFAVEPSKCFVGENITYTADLEGAPVANPTCRWRFTSRGGESFVREGNPLVTTAATGGYYTVELEVCNGQTVIGEYTRPDVVLYAARTNHVTCAAVDTAAEPFGSWATAHTNLHAVVDEYAIDGSVILLDEGTHYITKTVNLSNAVRLRGAGADKTNIRRKAGFTNTDSSIVVNNENAVLEHLAHNNNSMTITAERYHETGYFVYIGSSGGTISHCVFKDNHWTGIYGTGIVLGSRSSKGRITHCVVTGTYNNPRNDDNLYAASGVVAMTAGLIDNCLIADNRILGLAGLYLSYSANVVNCTITGNNSTNATSSATAVHPGPYGNAGIYLTSTFTGTIRNCIVAGNHGKIEGQGAYAPELSVESASFATTPNYIKNCIFGLTDDTLVIGSGSKIGYPKFVDAENGDYRIKNSSCWRHIGSIVGLEWLRDETDLWERPRVKGSKVDAGAYEADSLGLFLKLR